MHAASIMKVEHFEDAEKLADRLHRQKLALSGSTC